jgi:hypothetical protein
MSKLPPTPEDPASPTAEEEPDPFLLYAERRLRLLQEMSGIGMELLRDLKPGAPAGRDPITKTGPAKSRDPADAYAPLSRAIRLTLTLESRTEAEIRDLKAGIVRVREEERTRIAKRREADVQARGWKVRGLVMEAAEAEIADVDALEKLFEALEERLEEDEAYADFAERPVGETVERLCKDLALSPDWRRWNGEGWSRNDPLARPLFSEFNRPSAKPLLKGADSQPATPAPPNSLQNGHDLE